MLHHVRVGDYSPTWFRTLMASRSFIADPGWGMYGLPTEPDRIRKDESDDQASCDQEDKASGEIRIHHEYQPSSQLRPTFLFLPVHEQHESDAT